MARKKVRVRLKDRKSAKRERATRRARKEKKKKIIKEDMVFITSKAERVFHWYTFIMFFLTLVTGILILHKVDALPEEVGGTRRLMDLHIGLGVLFFLGILVMFFQWVPRAIAFRKHDAEWLRTLGGYFRKWSPIPPAGRLNAGQKIRTIVFMTLAFISFGTGLVMWLMQTPMQENISHGLHRVAISLHVFCYAFMVLLVFVHFYFTVCATPGTFGAMWSGQVKKDWVQKHHPIWYEKSLEFTALSEERIRRRRERALDRKRKRISRATSRRESSMEARKQVTAGKGKRKYVFKKKEASVAVEEEVIETVGGETEEPLEIDAVEVEEVEEVPEGSEPEEEPQA